MLNYATLYQRFKQKIYMMLNYATLYQRFKQRVYKMLNCAIIQVTGASSVARNMRLGGVIFNVARRMSR